MVTKIIHPTEQDLTNRVNEFDLKVNKALESQSLTQLYDQMAKQAISPGEKLEMIALKSLSSSMQEDLFKEFGFDGKKVTFAAERFLGK